MITETEDDAEELTLFADTTRELHERSWLPIAKRLVELKLTGRYSQKAAMRLFLEHANRAVKRYHREIDRDEPHYFNNTATRLAAENWAKAFEVQFDAGDLKYLYPKEYRASLNGLSAPNVDRRHVIEVANRLARGSRRRGAPTLRADASRANLIDWLSWNDPNGVYTDEANEAEGYSPLTADEAWGLVKEAVQDELGDLDESNMGFREAVFALVVAQGDVARASKATYDTRRDVVHVPGIGARKVGMEGSESTAALKKIGLSVQQIDNAVSRVLGYESEGKLGNLDVADEIWRQLGRARVMIGATGPIGDKDSLTFKVGANPKRVKWIKVRLDPSDTYTVTFIDGKGRPLHEVDDIYSDNLARVIEMHTGLRTSL